MNAIYFIRSFPQSKAIILAAFSFFSLITLNLYANESQTETLPEHSLELKRFLADCEEEYSPKHCKRGFNFANQTRNAFYKMEKILEKNPHEKESLQKTLPELRRFSLNPDEIDFQVFKSLDGIYTNEKCQSDFNSFFSENNQQILTFEEVEELCLLLDPSYLEGFADRIHPYLKVASSPLNDYLNTDAGRNFLQNVAPLVAIYTFLPYIAKIFIKILELARIKNILVSENLKSAFDRKSVREVHKKFFGHLFILVPAFFAQNFRLYLVSNNFSYEWAQKFTFMSLAFFYIHFTSHYSKHSQSVISKLDLKRLKELSDSALALKSISEGIQRSLEGYDLTRIKALGSGLQLLHEISVSPTHVLSSMSWFSMGFFSLSSFVIAFVYDSLAWLFADYLSITDFGAESWLSHLLAVCSASFLMHYTLSEYHKRIQEIKDERADARKSARKGEKKKEENILKRKRKNTKKSQPPPHLGLLSTISTVGSELNLPLMRPTSPSISLEDLSPRQRIDRPEATILEEVVPLGAASSASLNFEDEKEEDLPYGYDSGDELLEELASFCECSHSEVDSKKNK